MPHLTWGGGTKTNSIDFDLQRFSHVDNPYETTINGNIVSSGSLLSPTIYYPKSHVIPLGDTELKCQLRLFDNDLHSEIDYIPAETPVRVMISYPQPELELKLSILSFSIQERDTLHTLDLGWYDTLSTLDNYTVVYDNVVLPNNSNYQELAITPAARFTTNKMRTYIRSIEFEEMIGGQTTPTINEDEIWNIEYGEISSDSEIDCTNITNYKVIAWCGNYATSIINLHKSSAIDKISNTSFNYNAGEFDENIGEYVMQIANINGVYLYFINPDNWMDQYHLSKLRNNYAPILSYPMTRELGGTDYSYSRTAIRISNNLQTTETVDSYQMIGYTLYGVPHDAIVKIISKNQYYNKNNALAINLVI